MADLNALETDANQLVTLARAAGADQCDVVVASGETLNVGVRNGKLEDSKLAESNSLSLRVMCGKKVASVTTNTRTNPTALVERAVAMAKASPDDPYQGLADKSLLFGEAENAVSASQLELLDEFRPDSADLEARALACEQSGLEVKGVSNSMGAGASWSRSGFVLATSNGFSSSYERSGFSVHASLVAGEGTAMERDYDFDAAIHLSDLDDPVAIGRRAAERVVRRLGPRKVKSGNYPIVFDPRVSSSVLGALAGAINGSSIARKTSFLRTMLGKEICNPAVTILDDPHLKRRMGSRPFDGEGVRNTKMKLVNAGVLETWLLDTATARELELETNGRAVRMGTGTSPSTTNCFIEPGKASPEEMIKGISSGLYLTETIGHGINMVTGDYSKGAAGYWIENGEITFPVAEITIAGNLKDMFLNMAPANDLSFRYSTNAPTLLIEGMTIGGN